MTAAELLVQGLRDRGVHWIATLCGHGLDPLLDAGRRAGLRLVDVRNEQTCGYIADTFGRLTRRPGVCAVSSGVAHVNALTGVVNAYFDHAPMLLISGAGAVTTRGRGHFQELDQVAIARPVTRFSASIDAPELTLPLLHDAYIKALSYPPGPVHLMFPLDVQMAQVSSPEIVAVSSTHSRSVIGHSDLRYAAHALAEAEAPLIIAGSGIFYQPDTPDLLTFCTEFHIPVVTPIWDRGVVDSSSPVFLGVIGAATGGPAVLSNADCILLAGAENDYRVGYLDPPTVRANAKIFRMDGGWKGLSAECAGSMEKHRSTREAWLAACVERRDETLRAVEDSADEQARHGLHAIHIIRAIREVLSENPVLLIDGGSIGQWAHQLLCRDRYPGDWLTCGRSGVVGWGIGGAMAARLAYPKRPVILLSGDGAFTFNVADIECAVRQNLPFVAIVADDQGWGITRLGHVRQFGQPVASSLGPIAFDKLAASLGARGVRANTPEDITRELRDAIGRAEVTIVHVPISGGNP
jgi:acetolactate synthase-1/2/3 large subunit